MDSGVREQLLAAGLANQRRGRLADAERCYQLVLSQAPRDPDALYRMGVLALQCGNAAGAVRYLDDVRTIRTLDADGWYNLGMAHVLEYAFAEAQTAFEQARNLDPQHPSAAVSLGNVHKIMGRTKEAADAYLAAVASPRTNAVLFSQLLIALHTNSTIGSATLFDLHREWARRYAQPLYPRDAQFANTRDAHKRLAVGLVSPKFNGDIVGHFLRSIVRPLAADADVFLYHAGTNRDWVTEELANANVSWRDIARVDDETAHRMIVRDGIDVLVDLAGHAPGNRLQLFARRPAPVQATWLDYFDTTGIDTIDLIIADPISTPPALVEGGAQRFVESVAYLPHSRLCFAPPPFAPPVSTLPALRNGHVTFGCFGRVDKMLPEVIALWARVLLAVPGARLLLKSGGFDVMPARERIADDFAARGVADERITFRGPSSHEAMLLEYGGVDIALDTFPYNGGATTCDALWMGVPVITLAGETMIARQGASLLSAAGHPEWITRNPDEYVAIASDVASDVQRLADVRAALRPQLSVSPLCDGAGFAGDLLDLLRGAWQRWCETAQSGRTLPVLPRSETVGATPRSFRGSEQRGLSLLELLIVLMLMAIVAAMTVPLLGNGVSNTQLRSAAREVAAGMRLARSEAVSKRRDAVLTLDLGEHWFQVDRDPRKHALPRDVEMKLYTAQRDLVSESVGAVRFFPDGGSTGGRVTLAAGERKFDIDIDWLTGRVEIAP